MKITLTDAEVYTILYNILVNGINCFPQFGLRFDYTHIAYSFARKDLRGKRITDPCREDVYIHMLATGRRFHIMDIEGDGTHSTYLTFELAKANLIDAPANLVLAVLNETSDADMYTHFNLLQHILWKDTIFC